MNARYHLVEIPCNHKEASDVAQVLLHSLVFFRTHGKFNYQQGGSYSIGTLGYDRAVCDNIDISYVRCSSPSLVNRINSKIQEFVDKITDLTHMITLTLEFYTKRPSRWPFNECKSVWEVWNIKLLFGPNSTSTAPTDHHHDQQQFPNISYNRVEDVLMYKLLDIMRTVNSDKFSLPHMPTQANLDTVFDTGHGEAQPYLHNLSYKISELQPGATPSTGMTNKIPEGNFLTDSSTQSSLKKFLLGTLEL